MSQVDSIFKVLAGGFMFHAVLGMLAVIHRHANRPENVIHRLFHYAVLRFPHCPQFSDYFPNAL